MSDPDVFIARESLLNGQAITINGGGGNDVIIFPDHADFLPQLVVNGGADEDELRVTGNGMSASASAIRSYGNPFATYAGMESLRLNFNGGEIIEDLNGVNLTLLDWVYIQTPQHLGRFEIVFGTVSAFGQLSCTDLILGESVGLDMRNNDLLVNYSSDSPLGSWNGSGYTGLTGRVRFHSRFPPKGIYTSLQDVSDTVRRMCIAEASHALGLSGTQTELWNGDTVDATTVIVKYTYLGDIDLNGEINGDDYFHIDSNVVNSGLVFGYDVGDINLDGLIDGDDYIWLDSQILSQGPPL